MTRSFKFGDVAVDITVPEGFPLAELIVDLSVHAKSAESFHAAVSAAGGLSGFEPIRPDITWIDTPDQGEDAKCDITVFAPAEVSKGSATPNPGMAALAAAQAEVAS